MGHEDSRLRASLTFVPPQGVRNDCAVTQGLAEDDSIDNGLGRALAGVRGAARPAPAPKGLAGALRIPGPLAEQFTRALEDNTTRMPRHTWILEAIVEKLNREA